MVMETLTPTAKSNAGVSALQNLCDYAVQLISTLDSDRNTEDDSLRISDCEMEQNRRSEAAQLGMLIRRNEIPLLLEDVIEQANGEHVQLIESITSDNSPTQNYSTVNGTQETIDITDGTDTTTTATDNPIDLTKSSSESECEDLSNVREIDVLDDEVHIVAPNATPGRKRRRAGLSGMVRAMKSKELKADAHNSWCAASNGASIENAEIIEQFKNSLKCSICLDLIDRMTSTICGHVFCRRCIRSAIQSTKKCPLCQRKLRIRDIHGLFF